MRYKHGLKIFALLFLALFVAVSVSGARGHRKMGNVGIGLNHLVGDSALYSSGNISLLGNVDTLRGVQIGVFTSGVRQQMRGVSIGGLMTASGGDVRGLQLAGVSNIAHGGNGMQMALFTNASTNPYRGIQASGICNIAMGVKRGIQFAAVANVCASHMRGVQMGGYNYADTLSGSQFGIVNVCVSHPRGVQVGIINYSRDTVAHKIGLVNVNPKTRVDLMAFVGSSTKMNIAVRFRNKSTYNIIGVGTHYFGLDERFSGALFYRVGQYFNIGSNLTLSGDLGYYHVESFMENSDEKPERLYSLQGRLNLDWQAGHYVGVFASVGYGDTRYYYHSRHYRRRMLLEAGMTFRLARKS